MLFRSIHLSCMGELTLGPVTSGQTGLESFGKRSGPGLIEALLEGCKLSCSPGIWFLRRKPGQQRLNGRRGGLSPGLPTGKEGAQQKVLLLFPFRDLFQEIGDPRPTLGQPGQFETMHLEPATPVIFGFDALSGQAGFGLPPEGRTPGGGQLKGGPRREVHCSEAAGPTRSEFPPPG